MYASLVSIFFPKVSEAASSKGTRCDSAIERKPKGRQTVKGMADMKAVYAGVGAYMLYMFALEWGVLPNKVILITKLTPTVRKDLRTYNSQFILRNFFEKGSQGHFSLTLFNGLACCFANLCVVTGNVR